MRGDDRHNAVRCAVRRMDYAYAESLLTSSAADARFRHLVFAARRFMVQGVYDQTLGFMERVSNRDRVRTRRSARLVALEYVTDTCVICMEHRSIVTMLPCQHRCLCAQCNLDLITEILRDERALEVLVCPICRSIVDGERIWD